MLPVQGQAQQLIVTQDGMGNYYINSIPVINQNGTLFWGGQILQPQVLQQLINQQNQQNMMVQPMMNTGMPQMMNNMPVAANNLNNGYPPMNSGLFTESNQRNQNTPTVVEASRYQGYRRNNPQRESIQVQEVKPEIVQEVKKPYKELIISEGTEMDRSRHQLVQLGQTDTSASERYAHMAQLLKDVKSNSQDTPDFVLEGANILEPCLESAIQVAKVKLYEYEANGNFPVIYRVFGIIVKSIYTKTDINELFTTAINQRNFVAIATEIKNILKNAKGNENYPVIEQAFSELNTILTGMVNDFLISQVHIFTTLDSFVDDIEELIPYLLRKPEIPNTFQALYEEFQQTVVNSLNEEIPTDARDAIGSYIEHDGLNVQYVPINVSLSFINYRSAELGLPNTKDLYLINKETAPVLHDLISTIGESKRQKGMRTIEDHLVFSDMATYRVYRLKNGDCFIRKV